MNLVHFLVLVAFSFVVPFPFDFLQQQHSRRIWALQSEFVFYDTHISFVVWPPRA